MYKSEVLIITPPTRCNLMQIFSKTYIWQRPIDPIALRIASILREHFTVRFLPLYSIFQTYYMDQDWTKVTQMLDEEEPQVVVFSNDYYIADRSTSSYPTALKISRYIKEKHPNVKIIMTGRNVSALGRKVLEDEPMVDAVVIGECEEIIVDLVLGLLNNDHITIPGVIYHYKETICVNSGYNYVQDLNTLPVPAYDLLKEKLDIIVKENNSLTGRVLLSLRTSRGCVFKCAFCGGVPYWNNYRMRSAENVEKDIKACIDHLGTRGVIRFIDDEFFTYDVDHLRQIRDVLMKWNIHINMILTISRYFNDEVAAIVKNFTETVSFGIENVHDEIVKKMNKPQTFQEVMKAVDIAKKHSLKVNLFWITGLPGENTRIMFDNLQKMYQLLAENRVDTIMASNLNLHPGIDIEQNPEKYGLEIIQKDWGSCNEEGSYPAFQTEYFTRDDLFKYYLLSQYVIQQGQSLSNILTNAANKPIFDAGNLQLFEEYIIN